MADQIIARRWLIDLGRLTAARANPIEVEDFLETMAPNIAKRFPNESLNDSSLEYVAAECKYLPTYGELVNLLRGWKQSLAAPSYPAINDNVVDLPPKERTWITYW